MAERELRIETLLDRRVVDGDGKSLGPIEEIVVEDRDGVTRVVAYRVGAYGFLARLAGSAMRRSMLAAMGRLGKGRPYVVPWDRMDLFDPARPRLRGTVDDLRRSQPKDGDAE